MPRPPGTTLQPQVLSPAWGTGRGDFSRAAWYCSPVKQGSPIPGLRTGTSLWPVGHWATQQEVSGGPVGKASSAVPTTPLSITACTIPLHPTALVKTGFHGTDPWCRKGWGPLLRSFLRAIQRETEALSHYLEVEEKERWERGEKEEENGTWRWPVFLMSRQLRSRELTPDDLGPLIKAPSSKGHLLPPNAKFCPDSVRRLVVKSCLSLQTLKTCQKFPER